MVPLLRYLDVQALVISENNSRGSQQEKATASKHKHSIPVKLELSS